MLQQDLYYRLAVIELQLPTLEERGVIDKVAIFRAVTDEVLGTPLKARLGDPPSWLIETVAGMHFPGNVRQLRSLSERLGVIARQTGRWDQPLYERALHSAGNMAPAPALPAARPCGSECANTRFTPPAKSTPEPAPLRS